MQYSSNEPLACAGLAMQKKDAAAALACDDADNRGVKCRYAVVRY
jgi:hypothetical protein